MIHAKYMGIYTRHINKSCVESSAHFMQALALLFKHFCVLYIFEKTLQLPENLEIEIIPLKKNHGK
jgi:hypothetical protein